MLTPIFPTFINEEQLLLDNNAIEKECQLLRENQPETVSFHKFGWKSRDIDYTNIPEAFVPLVNEINKKINTLFQNLGYDTSKYEAHLTGAWVVINGTNDYMLSHIHQRAFFSGAYYVKAKPNCGNIVFKSPLTANNFIVSPLSVSHQNMFTSPTLSVEPKQGSLLIFPGWLEHQVQANLSGDERIVFSFNADIKQN
jgi:uncharacterized protein (TIGR02466 family)